MKTWAKSDIGDVQILKDINEMISLLDGAYDIVTLFKPVGPAQIEWKKNWLEKAKKYGASPE